MKFLICFLAVNFWILPSKSFSSTCICAFYVLISSTEFLSFPHHLIYYFICKYLPVTSIWAKFYIGLWYWRSLGRKCLLKICHEMLYCFVLLQICSKHVFSPKSQGSKHVFSPKSQGVAKQKRWFSLFYRQFTQRDT